MTDGSTADFALFAFYWRQTNCGQCDGADLTNDGRVDTDDLLIGAGNGKVYLYQSVPETTTFLLVGLSSLALLRKRRDKSLK